MDFWNSLPPVQRTLMRRAVRGGGLAGTIEEHATARRWAGEPDAPLRSLTHAEQRSLVPEFAAAAQGLVRQGLLAVHARPERYVGTDGPALTGVALTAMLDDPGAWIWAPRPTSPQAGLHAVGPAAAWTPADTLPPPEAAFPEAPTDEEDEILVCAMEVSGWLTGAYGIWEEPPASLGPSECTSWAERLAAPLLPMVRAGLIEVRHFTHEDDDSYTVVPADHFVAALADPDTRYQGDAWGVGLTCVFTYAGVAARYVR